MHRHSPGPKTTNKHLLVVVYGLKTRDYAYLEQFYPALRLAEEAANRSLSLRFLFTCDVPDYLKALDPERTPDNTVFLFRGSVPLSLITLIDDKGFICINPPRAVNIAGDKRETARFLMDHGYPCPHLYDTAHLPQEADAWPLVGKPRFGSRGNGVQLIQWGQNFPQEDYLLQEYIETSHGRDFRVFFAGKSILASVERYSEETVGKERPLVSNSCTGGRMRPSPFGPSLPESIATMTAGIAEQAGLWYGTIDFLYCTATPDPEHLTVCELNAFPGFAALETDGGYNIAGPLMDMLESSFLSKQLF